MQAEVASPTWPLLVSAAGFITMAVAEALAPLGAARGPKSERIVHNFVLMTIAGMLTGLFPIGVYSAAEANVAQGWGLFQHVAAPWPVVLLVALIGHSFTQYWLHRAGHHFTLLWWLHSVHHSDAEYDVSTSFRNHPLELLFSLPQTIMTNLVLGLDPDTALTAATIATLASYWTHAAIRVPSALERVLGAVLVTPARHRIHHAVRRAEHDSNYGDYLILWDWLFGTLRRAPDAPATVGLGHEGPDPTRLGSLLLWPIGLSGGAVASPAR